MSNKTFFGVPMLRDNDCDIRPAVPQKTGEDLVTMVQTLFNTYPEVIGAGFVSYIPYFNDGSPCDWGVQSKGLQFKSEVFGVKGWNESYDYPISVEGWVGSEDARYAYPELFGGADVRDPVTRTYSPGAEGSRMDLLEAFKSFRVGDEYESVIREHFGEHVTVKFLRDDSAVEGIRVEVEYFEHD